MLGFVLMLRAWMVGCQTSAHLTLLAVQEMRHASPNFPLVRDNLTSVFDPLPDNHLPAIPCGISIAVRPYLASPLVSVSHSLSEQSERRTISPLSSSW